MNKYLIIALFIINFIFSNEKIKKYPYIDINKMNLKDKISQMIMIRVDGEFYNNEHWRKKNIIKLISKYSIGGLISYTGSIHGTFYNLKEYQSISKIPLFVAADYERGIGQFIDGTLFPSNMAIAASNSERNAFKQGVVTAKESNAVGVNMIFAPVLDINNNPNNPIINFRSYGDNAETVIKFGLPFIEGVQSEGIIACGKHFPGHGDTDTDSHTSMPIINKKTSDLYNEELRPFKSACDNHIGAIMVGHILLPELDKDNPATFSKIITNNILRKKWNYDGLIITDALEMGALSNSVWHGEAAVKAIEGGADIILLPVDAEEAINSIHNAVLSGRISEQRINESIHRIINKKKQIGLFDDNATNWENIENIVRIKEHTQIAQNIANESITLVKNDKELIPLDMKKYKNITHLMISMDEGVRSRFKTYARDIKKTHGNVTEIVINDKLSKLRTRDILNQLKGSDLVIISMLVRIKMDKGISTIDESHDNLIYKISKMKIPILAISFGSPYLPTYSNIDAYICAYGYGSISLTAAANSIFGRINIKGKLPINLNDKYKIGHGIEINKISSVFNQNENIDFYKAINVIDNAIQRGVFPGAQVFISRGDNILMNKGFGKVSDLINSKNVTPNTIYDVASLTKVISTTPIIMKLVENNKLSLNYPLSDFYPEYDTIAKKNITIRHLLTHTSGLGPYKEYYKQNVTNRQDIITDILSQDFEYIPDSKFVYSDLGMILLLDIVEKLTGSKLDKLSNIYLYNPLVMNDTFFNPDKDVVQNIAPTEKDDYFRNKLLQGIVHDETAYILGGVASHAGLFSTANDIGKYCKMLIDGGLYLGKRYFSKNTIETFTKRQNIPEGSDRALGWDTPSQNGNSSAGDHFSKFSFGHLGFTGTSVWVDPESGIIVVLLTNSINPTRNKSNRKKNMYQVRRDFHMEVMEKILGV